MAKKSRSKDELETEIRFLKKINRNQIVISLGKPFVWGLTIVGVFHYIYKMVKVLAGHETFADIGIKFLADINFAVAISLVAGTGGCLYGLHERRLRKSTVERLQTHNQVLEQKFDPNRSTSYLTTRGDTRPEDIT